MIVMMFPAFATFVLCSAGITLEVMHPRLGGRRESLGPEVEVLFDFVDAPSEPDQVLLAA